MVGALTSPSPTWSWDETAHDGVLKILDEEAEGAVLIAEGRIAPASGDTFRRWRLSQR